MRRKIVVPTEHFAGRRIPTRQAASSLHEYCIPLLSEHKHPRLPREARVQNHRRQLLRQTLVQPSLRHVMVLPGGTVLTCTRSTSTLSTLLLRTG